MKRIMQASCGLVLILALHVSHAKAQWVGGARTWSHSTTATRATINIPFVSDYPNYWGQDNFNTYATYAATGPGQVITESCWQSWTGTGVQCLNPTTTTITSGFHPYDVWNAGCGYISSTEDPTDYFYEEVVTVSPALISLAGISFGQ